MRDLLKPTGVLAICIDGRELFHLGKMLDELFRPENRLAIINWEKSYSPRADNRHVSTATEYVLVYAKNEEVATTALLPRTAEMDARYKSPDGDPRLWKAADASGKRPDRQEMVYAIQSPFTRELEYPPDGSCWRPAQREVVKALEGWGCKFKLAKLDDDERRAAIIGIRIDELRPVRAVLLDQPLEQARRAATKVLKAGPWPRVFFGYDGQGRPQLKKYLEDVRQGKVPTTYWADDDWASPLVLGAISWEHEQSGHSQTGIDELTAIVGDGHKFQTVKPLKLFSKVIHIWCPPDGLVLDPFAGSGTTGHAVVQLNRETGADRRFILIEQGRPEKGDPYARSLMADRLRRVIEGGWANGRMNVKLSNEELRRARQAVAAARQEAEHILTDAREEADAVLDRAATMVRDAREQATRIISDARGEAEQIVKAARDRPPQPTMTADGRRDAPVLIPFPTEWLLPRVTFSDDGASVITVEKAGTDRTEQRPEQRPRATVDEAPSRSDLLALLATHTVAAHSMVVVRGLVARSPGDVREASCVLGDSTRWRVPAALKRLLECTHRPDHDTGTPAEAARIWSWPCEHTDDGWDAAFNYQCKHRGEAAPRAKLVIIDACHSADAVVADQPDLAENVPTVQKTIVVSVTGARDDMADPEGDEWTVHRVYMEPRVIEGEDDPRSAAHTGQPACGG